MAWRNIRGDVFAWLAGALGTASAGIGSVIDTAHPRPYLWAAFALGLLATAVAAVAAYLRKRDLLLGNNQ